LSQYVASKVIALACGLLLATCTTAASLGATTTIVVATDGSGQFTSVQAAVDSIAPGSAAHVIHVKPGTYVERVRITKDKPPMTLRGDDPGTTRITYRLGASDINPETGKPTGTDGSSIVSFESDGVTVENLTFENSYGPGTQAVAVKVTGDRVVFRNCRFLGYQDTLYIKAHGRHYFADCCIEGAVDFIFGRSTAVFENCEIRSTGKGYITAASTEPETAYGYVFYRCRLTAADGVEPATMYLGRPWRPHANVVYLECEMGEHIRPEGWDNWRNPDNEKTAHFAEYKSTGPGSDTSRRVSWSRQLSDAEAARFDPDKVLAGDDGWAPRKP
jgi:pectinesterase